MADAALDVGDDLSGIGLIPAPIKVLGYRPELDEEIAGLVLWLHLAPLFLPKLDQRLCIIAHDDSGV